MNKDIRKHSAWQGYAKSDTARRSKSIQLCILMACIPVLFLLATCASFIFINSATGKEAKALLAAGYTLIFLWLIKTLLTARRKNTQPWKIIHLPTQYPQPRKSLQPYGWTAMAFIAAAIALTFYAIHSAATYHQQPWSAYVTVPTCLALAATAIYAGRKHAIANGPHPGGPVWWFNNNYYTRPIPTDPILGGILLTAMGLTLPVMALIGHAPGWRTTAALKAWILLTLIALIGIGIIVMGVIQKRWERTHPQTTPGEPQPTQEENGHAL